MLTGLFLVWFLLKYLVLCSRLIWLSVSFWLHIKYTVSAYIVLCSLLWTACWKKCVQSFCFFMCVCRKTKNFQHQAQNVIWWQRLLM